MFRHSTTIEAAAAAAVKITAEIIVYPKKSFNSTLL
jgi:hypothetical protein